MLESKSLMWATDAINGSLAELNWQGLQQELAALRGSWVKQIISSAKEHHQFFPPREPDASAEDGLPE